MGAVINAVTIRQRGDCYVVNAGERSGMMFRSHDDAVSYTLMLQSGARGSGEGGFHFTEDFK